MTRTYAPPTPASPLFAPSPRLARPWPLLPVGIADLGYTLWYAARAPVPAYLLAMTGVRSAVLALFLAPSLRWRARGGAPLASTGATLLACVWTVCAQTMLRHEDEDERPVKVAVAFLLATAGISIFEYIFYILLVRLVPSRLFQIRGPPPLRSPSSARSPSLTPVPGRHRRHSSRGRIESLHLHMPATTAGTAGTGTGNMLHLSPDGYDAPSSGNSALASSPEFLRPQAYYSRREAIEEGSEAAYDGYDEGEGEYAGQDASVPVGSSSRPGYYGALGIGRSQTATHGYAYNHPYDFDADPERRGSYDYERVHDPDHDCDYDCDCSYDDDDGSSTVSESSIIDLPRGVLSPLPLELDGALAEGVAGLGEIVGGVAAGVGAAAGAAVDIASGAGNIVRRSASSRFLPRSWTSTEEGSVGGYGTFGRGATPADGTGDADRAQRKGKHSRGGSTAGQ